MSYQPRQNQRGGTRTQNQNVHQQWVPRASTPTIGSSGVNRPTENRGSSTGSVPQASTSILGNPQPSSSLNHPGENRGRSNVFVPPSNHKRVQEPVRRNEGEVKPAESKASQPNNSNQPQLVQEIQEKLMKGTVECMICYDMVRRSSPIWSCSGCYSIFHLNCIKRWANAPGSVDRSAEKNRPFNWRCPGCQMVQLTAAKDIRYTCFCSKRKNPSSDLYLTPHSCGEPCGKRLEKEITSPPFPMDDSSSFCPHFCILQCHPGPCPPCKAFAPPRPCPCGRRLFTTRCADQKSATLTCGRPCGKPLDCGRHRCAEVCHSGPCDTCRSSVEASCFCGRKAESVSCCSIGGVKGELVSGKGVLSCGLPCGKSLGCGNHRCAEVCHPGRCGGCELMPERVDACHCGKTYLSEHSRESCLDPIPTCAGTCAKPLPCGVHLCGETCHAGSCPPCPAHVTQMCRCGSSSRTTECFRTADGTFACERPCGRKKNCGRHRCSDRCCPLAKASNDPGREADPHFCSILCRKKLRCGQHPCELLCHSGHCPPCPETIFAELTCVCGKTSAPPPLPCGTPPPSCQLPCAVPLPCGHPPLHSCHFGDCPPCSVLVAKGCVGGHTVLSNIPCGSKDVRCHRICGRTRRCGAHLCTKTCHSPPCDPLPDPEGSGPSRSCGQTCGLPRRECPHACASLCHPGSPCPDSRCDFSVVIGCSCGRMTAGVPCDTGGSVGGFSGLNVPDASLLQKLQSVESNNRTKVPLGRRKLMCDEECAKLERKRVLDNAFDVARPRIDLLSLGENGAVPQSVLNTVRLDPKWASSVEERCRFLVSSRSRGGGGGGALKAHVFCPLLKEKRDALRVIAERWRLAVGSAGWEPRRFTVVHVTAKSKPPSYTTFGSRVSGSGCVNAPAFDPVVDMDPSLVVSFPDLPRDADISGLVLRFGGECELVWLDDKNAVAVFNDRARAATAMRRLDHGSTYQGACGMAAQVGGGGQQMPAGGGGGLTPLKGSSWKKCVEEGCGGGGRSTHGSAKGADGVVLSNNRWSALESDAPAVLSPPPGVEEIERKGFPAVVVVSPPGVDEMERKGYAGTEAVAVLENWEEGCI